MSNEALHWIGVKGPVQPSFPKFDRSIAQGIDVVHPYMEHLSFFKLYDTVV